MTQTQIYIRNMIILLLMIVMPFSANASAWKFWGTPSDHGRIYQAMSAFPQTVENFGPIKKVKMIGGLRCRELSSIGSGGVVYFDYKCRLGKKDRDDEKIYRALMISPKREASASAGVIIDVKTVDDLTCTETRKAQGDTSYHCRLR